jgi:hypothetical protein
MIKREDLLKKVTFIPVVTLLLLVLSIGIFFYSKMITIHGFKIFLPEMSLVAVVLAGIPSLLLLKEKIDLKYLLMPLILLGFMSISSILSIKPVVSFKETLRWAEILVAFFFTLHLVKRAGEVKAILVAIILMGIFQSLWGMKLLSDLPAGERMFSRYFDNPNLLALYLDFSPTLIVALFFAEKKTGWRIWCLSSLVVIGMSLYLTRTLGSRISNGFVLVLFFLAFLYRKTGKELILRILKAVVSLFFKGLIILFFLFLFIVSFSPGLTENLLKKTESGILSHLSSRFYFYTTGFHIIEDFPLTGVGGNLYKEVAPYYIPFYAPKEWTEVLKTYHLHSLFIKIAAENGLLTLLAFLFFLSCVGKDVFSALLVLKGERYWLLVGVAGSILTWLLHNILDEGFSLMGMQWGILLGLAVSMKKGVRNSY